MKHFAQAIVAAAALCCAVTVQAQTNCGGQSTTTAFNTAGCSVNHSVSATVPYLASISTSNLAAVTIAAPTAAAMGGYTDAAAGPAITVSSNFTYTLTASSSAFAAVGSYTKAKGDLEIGTNTSNVAPGSFTSMGSNVVMSSSAAATAASTTLYTFFRMKLLWTTDVPGTYSATVTYTLTAP